MPFLLLFYFKKTTLDLARIIASKHLLSDTLHDCAYTLAAAWCVRGGARRGGEGYGAESIPPPLPIKKPNPEMVFNFFSEERLPGMPGKTRFRV